MSSSDSESFQQGELRTEGDIRYGDHIALKHVQTGRLLTSNGSTYVEGSQQQIVFAGGWKVCQESEWIVMPTLNSDERPGYEVGWDDSVRLKHVGTRCNLHSHSHASPVSGQQEVSCFGDDCTSDENDVWVVKKWDEDEQDGDLWRVGEPFILIHEGTRARMHSHDIRLSEEDINEVTCFHGDPDENDKWIVAEDDY